MTAWSEITDNFTVVPVASPWAAGTAPFTSKRPVEAFTMVLTSVMLPSYSLPPFSTFRGSPGARPAAIFSGTAKLTLIPSPPEMTHTGAVWEIMS